MLAAFVVLALAASGAWSSSRPPECAEESGRSANVWERAKSPELERYCDLVASASSKLAGTAAMAQTALESAREADKVLPGHAAPRVLEGRALAALGRMDEAVAALEDGKARDARGLDDPLALLAWARVLARRGRADEAADAYRELLPRATALSSAERAAAAVEAGLVAMGRGPARLDDAVAALRGALHEVQDDTQSVAALGLALALDRRGETQGAQAVLSERTHGDPRAALASGRAKELLAVAPGESPALAALALEATDAAGARAAWEAYLAGAGAGPWAAHARGHLAALGSKHAAGRGPR